MASEQQIKDHQKLTQDIHNLRENFFSTARMIDRSNANEIVSMGYRGKTRDEIITLTYRKFNDQITELVAKFIRKYPD